MIDTARQLAPAAIHVVYGHGGERVREALKSEAVSWVLQERQLGTGHAVMQALPGIPDAHTVLVLYGDVPLIRGDTLEKLLKLLDAKTLAILTVMLEDPARLWAHPARCPRAHPQDRRAQGCIEAGAAHPRVEYRDHCSARRSF